MTGDSAGIAPVIALTDEELCALDGGPDAEQVAPRPWLDTHDDAGRRLACEVAARGLAARNLIVASASPAGEAGFEIHRGLKTALDIRRSSASILVAQRQSTAGSHTRVLYIHDEGVLEEDVTSGGLHSFIILPLPVAAARLAGLADLAGAARDSPAGEIRTLSLTSIADGTPIAGSQLVRSVTVIGRVGRDTAGQPPDRRVAVHALRDRVLVTEPVLPDEQQGSHAEAMLVVTEVSSEQLVRRLEQLLATPSGAPS